MQYRLVSKALIAVFLLLMIAGCFSKQKTVSYKHDSSKTSQTINNSQNMHKATMRPYTVFGKKYYPTMVSVGDSYSGVASWYGKDFHGKKTSNGEIYNMHGLSAAHKTLPMNTMVRVTNTRNGKSIVVRINDRGPFVGNRVIDLSYKGATMLDFVKHGTTKVKIEILGFAGTTKGSKGYESSQKSVIINDFDVQIGAFRKIQGARVYRDAHSSSKGRYKAIIKEGIFEGTPIYRVWLQGFGSEAEARDFIENGEYPGSFIVREK